MRRIKNPKIGEYVLATAWQDKDMYDPWYIGHVSAIIDFGNEKRYWIKEDERRRFWRHVFRISEQEANERIELDKRIMENYK